MRQNLILRSTPALIIFVFVGAMAAAQDPLEAPPAAPSGQQASRKLSAAELDRLTSPIALYPDVLLSQILPAATFPDQIVDAALLIKTKDDAKLIAEQSWDASVQAIANYPGVLKMMYEKLSWTKSLGEAFLNQHKELLDSIQRLRAKAQNLGNLETNEQQKVSSESTLQGTTIIKVEPADPQVVYVPQTTSNVVYTEAQPSTTATLAPLVTFGLGMALGAAVSGNDDDDVYVHGGGYYYPPGGMWVSDDSYNDWYNQRRDTVEHMENQAKKRQDYRQDYRSDRQDFRQDMIENNPDQAKQYYDQRKQQAQERRSNAQQTASQRREDFQSSSAYQNRQGQSSSRQQQLDAARKDMQSRQWQQPTSAKSSDFAASRGYSGGAKNSSSGGAFGGVNSGSRASAYADRGAASRSSAGQYGGYGSRSSGGGYGSRSSGGYSGGSRSSGARMSSGGGRGGRGGGGGGGGRRR